MKLRTYHGAGCLLYYGLPGEPIHVFLGLRKHNPGKGSWSIPGGGREAGDGPGLAGEWATGRRETMEETTVTASALEQVADGNPPAVRFVLPLFK